MRHLFIIVIMWSSIVFGQSMTVEKIRDNVIAQFEQINDYQVDMKISVKMTGFRMPKKKIRVYYKRPDKIKVTTKGFAILPKTGVDGNPSEFLDMLKHVTEIKRTIHNNSPYYKIMGKVERDSLKIPLKVNKNETPEITMDVLVDAKKWVITEVDVYLDSESVFTFQTNYTEIDGIYVPERSIFKIGVKGISKWSARNPVDLGGPGSERQDFEDIAKNAGFDPEKDEFLGEMVMAFTIYKVNEGIDNKIFEEKQ